MKKLIVFLVLFIPFISFSQVESDTIVTDTSYDYEVVNVDVNEIDLIEDRNDTINTNRFILDLFSSNYNVEEKYYFIVFHELDNLLVIEDKKSLKKQYYFMDFRCEITIDNIITKEFKDNNNVYFTLSYIKNEKGHNEFVSLKLSRGDGYDITTETYFVH